MHNLKKRNSDNQKGFTIIEVMIVLAIAGLIMLIVFLAVPALQRNSRNTQYKNDAASILAAASEFTNNNNGTIPVTANNGAIMALTKTKSITGLVIQTGSAANISPTFDTATIDTGRKCNANVGGTAYSTTASATRAMVIVYAVEDSAGAVVAQCTES
ncbi:MAG: type II secretion system protein [Candidatus Saccharimonadales bacterium]